MFDRVNRQSMLVINQHLVNDDQWSICIEKRGQIKRNYN